MMNPLKMAEMLSQANQMQEEVQRKLTQTVVEGTSGGGAVTATMNGKKQLLKIRIEPAAVIGLAATSRTWRCWKTWWWPRSTRPGARPKSDSIQRQRRARRTKSAGAWRMNHDRRNERRNFCSLA